MLACAVCQGPGAVVEAGYSLCMTHLHDWLLSREGKTVRRLYGFYSKEPLEKRSLQAAALMKLFVTSREEWKVEEVPNIVLDEG